MQPRFTFSQTLTALMLTGFAAHSAGAQSRSAQSAPGELLVRWKSQRAPLVLAASTNPSRWQQSGLQNQLGARLPGAKVEKTFAASGWSLIKVPAGQSTAQARAALIQSLGAANVSLNYRRHAARLPNDPSYGSQWQWPKIQAPDAWNSGTGTRDVVVAVLDSGIDLTQPDLKANLWTNTREIAGDGIDNDGNGYVDDFNGLNGISPAAAPQDDFGHGTFCAGLIGAVGNNASGITGINWSVKIMALKFLDANGEGYDSDAIACLEYAIKIKKSGVNLRVMSHSYAGSDDNPAFKEAYQAVESAGILNVCAAGNETNNNDASPQYPSSYSTATNISVAATTPSDALASFSNYGAQSVDIAAPGENVISLSRGSGSESGSGTSYATPIVAGAAALISSLEPGLSASALKSRLMTNVDKIPALSGKVVSGGRLNLSRSVVPVSYGLKGQVYRLNGSARVPVSAAKVVLSGRMGASTSTDTNGNYSFGNLPPGSYTLTVTLKGYTFDAQTRTLAGAAGTSTVDFAATSAPSTFYTLFGVARNEAGAPVRGVSIALNTAPTTVLATTDANGKYAISGRSAGTYTLKATGADLKWTTIPGSIAVPDFAKDGKAEVNFRGVATDKSAPVVTIASPADGGTFAPGNQIAGGTARDVTGNKEIFVELTRYVNFVRSYYNWTARTWDAGTSPATTLTRTVGGKNANWSATLPNMAPASYSLRVWGRDTLGNISKGEADAFSNFNVVKSTSSAFTSGGAS